MCDIALRGTIRIDSLRLPFAYRLFPGCLKGKVFAITHQHDFQARLSQCRRRKARLIGPRQEDGVSGQRCMLDRVERCTERWARQNGYWFSARCPARKVPDRTIREV